MRPAPSDPAATSGDAASGDAASGAVVQARGLGKRFDIYLSDRSRLYEFFGNRRHHDEHWALREVDFEVRAGRSFGVVGPNGAGKSTLLKLIAGITRPSEGSLDVRASLATLLDLGLGFHADFTGRENIRLNCSLLGMSEAEIDARIPDIIGFAELGGFIDYPVRTYSAGMSLRLGFAIAAHAESDVFLVDEVLAVGDQYFQRRCITKIEEFIADGKTIILASHDLHAVRSLCDDVMWLEGGRVRMLGPAREVTERYLEQGRERVAPPTGPPPIRWTTEAAPPAYEATVDDPALREAVVAACAVPDPVGLWRRGVDPRAPDVSHGDVPVVQGTGEVRILSVAVLDGDGRPRERFRTGEDVVVAVTFRTTEPVPRPIFGVAVFRDDGVYVHGPNTRYDGVLDRDFHGVYTFFVLWRELPLLGGRYRLSVAVFDQGHLKPHAWHNQLYEFEVATELEDHGMVRLDHGWGLITWHEPT